MRHYPLVILGPVDRRIEPPTGLPTPRDPDTSETAARLRAERARRKAEQFAKRQPKRRACSPCNGWGWTQAVLPGGFPLDPVECDHCDGTGTVP